MPARSRSQHLPPDLGLADRVGRGGDVEDRLRPLRDQLLDRIAQIARLLPELLVVPEVLADGDAEPRSGDLDQRTRLRGGIEVTRFVKNVVGWQQGLAHHRRNPAALERSEEHTSELQSLAYL